MSELSPFVTVYNYSQFDSQNSHRSLKQNSKWPFLLRLPLIYQTCYSRASSGSVGSKRTVLDWNRGFKFCQLQGMFVPEFTLVLWHTYVLWKQMVKQVRENRALYLIADNFHYRIFRWFIPVVFNVYKVRSKNSQVKTQLVLWIFILFKVTRWQHVSASINMPSSGHK